MHRVQSRRHFLSTVGLGAASLAWRAASGDTPSIQRPTNVIVLLTDDQRFDAIHALGNEQIRTPRLDRLVEQGVAFTHACTMGATCGAPCIPSRAMLWTSRSLFHLKGIGGDIPPDHVMLPEYLRRRGYVTFGTGKWHNSKASFARAFTDGGKIHFGGMSDHWKPPVFDFDPTGRYEPQKKYLGDRFSSELFANEAIRFLRAARANAPFLLYVGFTAPHDPRTPPAEFAALYPPDTIALPPNFMARHPFDNGDLALRDELLAPWPRTPEIVRRHIADYYAMITHLDVQIGRILDALAESGQADNTLIVFAGDNGLALGQHGLLGKQSLYEHSNRVPLILAGPGLPRGKRCDGLCYLKDVYPTVCASLDVPAPPALEGLSLLSMATGGAERVREDVIGAYRSFQRMLRDERWKLILYNVGGVRTAQLFDLANDPWEMTNLAERPEHAQRIARMTARLQEEMTASGDPCILAESDWRLAGQDPAPAKP